MAEVDTHDPKPEDVNEPEDEEKNVKEVLIRNSDMKPDEECAIVGIANSAVEEVADLQGIFETQKYSKMSGIIKR